MNGCESEGRPSPEDYPELMGSRFGFRTRLGWVRLHFSQNGLSGLIFTDDCEETSDCRFRDIFLKWLPVFEASDAETQYGYLDLSGTAFQKSVWRELLNIRFGDRIRYGEVAGRLGHPRACRAVGSAVGANPVSVLVPCHRVLPGTGQSGHYRWGADRKVKLLDAERTAGSNLSTLFQ